LLIIRVLSSAFKEDPGRVYEDPAFRDHWTLFVVDFSVALVGLGGHGLEEACAADGRIQTVSSGPADCGRDPDAGMRTENQVGVVGLDEIQPTFRALTS